jgi:hypothetical protein
MAPKHPYLDEADKAAFLHDMDNGDDLIPAAKKAKINVKTARGIKKRADKIIVYCDENDLPPPSLHDRLIIAPKPGRHRVLTELDINQLDVAIGQDRRHRDMYQFEVAKEMGLEVSKNTIRTAATSVGYHRVNPTKKLALTPIQEAIRYEIALSRKDWTMDDWRRVSFSDEASILVGEHRGPHKISRKVDERYDPDCIEVRYNNYSEAMFWGTFSYDFKGPCHVYLKGTAADKKRYNAIIKAHNDLQLPAIRAEWGIKVAKDKAKWLALNRLKPGKPALFENFRKKHRLIMRRERGKGGIYWMRYRYEVVEPLVVPYMYERSLQRPHDPDDLNVPGPIFQQDNAPSHISHWTLEYLQQEGIEVLEHPGNSPDMSAIEKGWMPMRISITHVWNRPYTLEWTARAWYAEWEALDQDVIRGWIHEMIENNQRIIDDQGGNHFHG